MSVQSEKAAADAITGFRIHGIGKNEGRDAVIGPESARAIIQQLETAGYSVTRK